MRKNHSFLQTAEEKLSSAKTQITTALVMASVGSCALPGGIAHADLGKDSSGNGLSSPEGLVKAVLDALVNLFPLIGIFFVLVGGAKVLNGVKNDNNPEAISAGAKDLVIGGALVAFRAFLWGPIKTAVGLGNS